MIRYGLGVDRFVKCGILEMHRQADQFKVIIVNNAVAKSAVLCKVTALFVLWESDTMTNFNHKEADRRALKAAGWRGLFHSGGSWCGIPPDEVDSKRAPSPSTDVKVALEMARSTDAFKEIRYTDNGMFVQIGKVKKLVLFDSCDGRVDLALARALTLAMGEMAE